ncbi:hypothetical protein J4E91_010018 [Alternaria rosae]|nr:hypothetical protein J4E91_010018 [Alternaria rosae]
MSASTSISNYAPPPLPSTPTTTLSLIPSITQNTRGNCAPQEPAYGPTPVEDNMWSFYSSPLIREPALNATTPDRYSLSFQGANASYAGKTYLGYYELHSYDTSECARKCDAWGVDLNTNTNINPNPNSTPQESSAQSSTPSDQTPLLIPTPPPQPQICNGFNLYFERSPSIYLGPKCQDAASRTIIKCALWGEGVEEEGTTNTGYTEWDFRVVIAGSNGYRLGEEKAQANVEKSEGVKSVGRSVVWSGGLVVSVAVMIGELVGGGIGF